MTGGIEEWKLVADVDGRNTTTDDVVDLIFLHLSNVFGATANDKTVLASTDHLLKLGGEVEARSCDAVV